MAKRTEQEIARQIEGLEGTKKTVPEFSKWRDANWVKLDAQIKVLKGEAEPDDFYEDETAEEFEEDDNGIYFAAEAAEQWLLGHSNEDLFDPDDLPEK